MAQRRAYVMKLPFRRQLRTFSICHFPFSIADLTIRVMFGVFSRRVLPVLQLTRMALVFTAVADGWCSVLLLARSQVEPWVPVREVLRWESIFLVTLISAGLYGFGMSLNDIIDRRRDLQIAAHRPLPSGRIGVRTAHLICALMGLAGLIGGVLYARNHDGGWMTLVLLVWTALLIAFYDAIGKYLVAPGLLTLGLVRLFHATIPAPQVPLLWHPLLLFNHVTIVSTLAYAWEEKRPAITRGHVLAVAGGMLAVNLGLIGLAVHRRWDPGESLLRSLWVHRGMIWPIGAAVAFGLVAIVIRQRFANRRDAGQALILYGLLWLIIYDAAFVAGYVNKVAGLAVLALLPIAYLGVKLMRTWSGLLSLSQKPSFKRVET